MRKRILNNSLLTIMFGVLFFSFSNQAFAQEDSISTDPAAIAAGKSLFSANCKSCHNIHEKMVGPALANVYDRAPSIDWIKAFIKNPTRVIQSGDQYAVDLFEEYGVYMTAFALEDEQIMDILAYVQDETIKGPEVVAADPTAEGGGAAAAGGTVPTEYLNVIVIGLIVVLLLILGVLVLILNIMKRYLNQQGEMDEEDRELVDQRFSLGSMMRSKAFIFLATFILTALVAKGVINGLYNVGIQRGYAPTQPIAYSHELHAGQYEIDCNYCHTGVRKSKSANIPSANICMNCHSAIKPESPEIQKIYAALENEQPIEWVRIHNLPDLAYFNHAQHVQVADLECQTCHGAIEEMEVVEQHSLLTMGWCIECHRTTEVNTKDNAYYEKLLEYHKGEKMTVEDIGGLECAKCHY